MTDITIKNLRKQIDGLKANLSETESRIAVLKKTSKFLDSVNEKKENQDKIAELQEQLNAL